MARNARLENDTGNNRAGKTTDETKNNSSNNINNYNNYYYYIIIINSSNSSSTAQLQLPHQYKHLQGAQRQPASEAQAVGR